MYFCSMKLLVFVHTSVNYYTDAPLYYYSYKGSAILLSCINTFTSIYLIPLFDTRMDAIVYVV